jgi:hypothetical protein
VNRASCVVMRQYVTKVVKPPGQAKKGLMREFATKLAALHGYQSWRLITRGAVSGIISTIITTRSHNNYHLLNANATYVTGI